VRKKISASFIRRVERLEKDRGARKLQPVAMFPRLVSVDEWGVVACQMQAVLKDNIKENAAPDYGDLPKLELVASRCELV